jgi:hypothetical protein
MWDAIEDLKSPYERKPNFSRPGHGGIRFAFLLLKPFLCQAQYGQIKKQGMRDPVQRTRMFAYLQRLRMTYPHSIRMIIWVKMPKIPPPINRKIPQLVAALQMDQPMHREVKRSKWATDPMTIS